MKIETRTWLRLENNIENRCPMMYQHARNCRTYYNSLHGYISFQELLARTRTLPTTLEILSASQLNHRTKSMEAPDGEIRTRSLFFISDFNSIFGLFNHFSLSHLHCWEVCLSLANVGPIGHDDDPPMDVNLLTFFSVCWIFIKTYRFFLIKT